MTNRNAASMLTYGSTWESHGYCGDGLGIELIDSLQDRPAIVCGSAEGVFYELETALAKEPQAVIFGVNDVGMYLPKLDHWVSLHADNLGAWKAVRWLHAREREHTVYHSIDSRPCIDYVWSHLTPLFALSGYFAMQLAYVMGAGRIILCGCPGNAMPRFFEGGARADFGYGSGANGSDKGTREQVEQEMRRLPAFKERVRSTSGWTREFFGRP